ncbi:bifunctional hydroxymethylpyrimidine kinase/phosphomethylpyrimidine kinase [Deltaproteobacteria bacterium]|nr:bifunctional hydroxymethylpyrimidine kinase/phosphomethylpyrimidine kinase [Deltaproteobacteria bacterium]
MIYVLTIAGSDSSGGAGIQADIKTITGLGAHALTAVTAITAQNSMGVVEIYEVPERIVSLQIETVIKEILPGAVKIGMMHSGGIIREVARVIKKNRLERVVIDPVLRASAGGQLLEESAVTLLKDILFPLATVITPNLEEAGILTGKKVENLSEMEEAAREMKGMGPDVVLTGGHLEENCVDLVYNGTDMHYFQGSKIETANTHGSGCVFSSSLATFLAMDHGLVEAAGLAHDFTRHAIEKGYACGHGAGVVSPGYSQVKKIGSSIRELVD